MQLRSMRAVGSRYVVCLRGSFFSSAFCSHHMTLNLAILSCHDVNVDAALTHEVDNNILTIPSTAVVHGQ